MVRIGMPQLFELDRVEDNLKLGRQLGVDFIELNLNFGYCRQEMEEGRLAELFAQYGLAATLHFYDEADLGSYPEVVAAYLTLLERYCRLGRGYVESMNVHLIPGPVVTISGIKNYIYEREYAAYIQRLVHNLKQAEKICQDNGLRMVIENTDTLPDYCRRTYGDLYRAGFKFCYDIGHDHLSYDIVAKVLSEYQLEFKEFHFHDAMNRKTCHLSLGEGALDLKAYKTLAESQGADVLLEVKQASDLQKSVPFFKNL